MIVAEHEHQSGHEHDMARLTHSMTVTWRGILMSMKFSVVVAEH